MAKKKKKRKLHIKDYFLVFVLLLAFFFLGKEIYEDMTSSLVFKEGEIEKKVVWEHGNEKVYGIIVDGRPFNISREDIEKIREGDHIRVLYKPQSLLFEERVKEIKMVEKVLKK